MNEMIKGTHELWLVFLFLLAFLLFNILTATSYPFPHDDECMIAEPAISFIHGQGFGIRFAEAVAMYCFLLVPWMKLFGTSLESIRSAEVVCMTMAFLVLWSAVRRLEIVPRASWRLFLLLLLATEYGIIFAYRAGRYDGFGALLMASVLWLMSIKGKRMRFLSMFAVCLFVPWAGLQYMPVLFAAGLVLLLICPWRYWMEVAISFLASALGGVVCLIILSLSGRLSGFVKSLSVQQRNVMFISNLVKYGQIQTHNYIPKDFSFPFLFVAAIVLQVFLLRRKQITKRSVLSYGIIFAIILSVLLLLVAKFPTYYSYMIVIPVAVSVSSGLSLCKSGKVRNAVLLLCALSAAAGAGLNTAAYAWNRQDRKYSHVEQFIGQAVRADDVVYADPAGYLAARLLARDVYFPNTDWDIIPLMSQQQKDSITVVVIRPEYVEAVTKGLGGKWQGTGQRLAPRGRSIFGNRNMGFLTVEPVDLVVYRRR